MSRRGSSRRSRHAPAGPERLAAFAGPWRQTVDFYALLVLLGACALGGGSSFADTLSLLYLRPLALVCLCLFLLTPAPIEGGRVRAPLILLGLWAALMTLQLIPLPPSWWGALPGRTPYLRAALDAGLPQPWRPWSLTPDLTLNSLVSLVIPAAVLVGYAKLRDDQRKATVLVFLALCCLSAALGIAQFAGGKDSSLYLYRRTYSGFPVGFLANRNHHAALLALVFPVLRVWTLMPGASPGWARNRQWLALALGVLTIPVILATGSRAGIALMVLGIVGAFTLFAAPRSGAEDAGPRWRGHLTRLALPALMIVLVAVTYAFGRAASIERLVALSAIDSDQRFQFAPTVLQIIRETFPVGAGFGSFDPVFRQYEPDAILISSYFNHAHNELLELMIMAGVPGLLVLTAFLLWWGKQMVTAFRRDRDGMTVPLTRLGGVVVAFLLLASLVDYPLRAPLMAGVFALSCAWLAERRRTERVSTGPEAASVVTSDATE